MHILKEVREVEGLHVKGKLIQFSRIFNCRIYHSSNDIKKDPCSNMDPKKNNYIPSLAYIKGYGN